MKVMPTKEETPREREVGFLWLRIYITYAYVLVFDLIGKFGLRLSIFPVLDRNQKKNQQIDKGIKEKRCLELGGTIVILRK